MRFILPANALMNYVGVIDLDIKLTFDLAFMDLMFTNVLFNVQCAREWGR